MSVVTAQPAANLAAENSAARKAAIARSFDSAARSYDAHAPVQRRVARQLARHIASLPLPARPRILEIGCGTGFLSGALFARYPEGRFVFTDLSPAMARRCREKLARRGGHAQFAVMDGEFPAAGAAFDLVASSLAFQWFLELPDAIARLAACLRPGGRLAFATLGSESLAEWRALHRAAGLPFGGLEFPTASGLLGMAQGPKHRLRGAVTEQRVVRRYPDPLAFLRELKSLGAGTPGRDAMPGAAGLRRVLRQAEAGRGFPVTYHVLYGSFAAPLAAR